MHKLLAESDQDRVRADATVIRHLFLSMSDAGSERQLPWNEVKKLQFVINYDAVVEKQAPLRRLFTSRISPNTPATDFAVNC